MPIHTGQDKQGHFYQWGSTGKKYYYDPDDKKSKSIALNKAKKQQTAIYSSGWKGDGEKMKVLKIVKKSDAWNPSMGEFVTMKELFNRDNIHLQKMIYENGETFKFWISQGGINTGDEEVAKKTLATLKKMVAALEQAIKLAK